MRRISVRWVRLVLMATVFVFAAGAAALAVETFVDAYPVTAPSGGTATFQFRVYGDPGIECECYIVIEKMHGKPGKIVAEVPAGTRSPSEAMQTQSWSVSLHPGHYRWHVRVANRPATYSTESLNITHAVKR